VSPDVGTHCGHRPDAIVAAPLRIALAIAMMTRRHADGLPLTAGVRLLAATEAQLVAWAWGINWRCRSSAHLAVFIAMNWGFRWTPHMRAIVKRSPPSRQQGCRGAASPA